MGNYTNEEKDAVLGIVNTVKRKKTNKSDVSTGVNTHNMFTQDQQTQSSPDNNEQIDINNMSSQQAGRLNSAIAGVSIGTTITFEGKKIKVTQNLINSVSSIVGGGSRNAQSIGSQKKPVASRPVASRPAPSPAPRPAPRRP